MVTKRLHAWSFARIVVFAVIGLVATEAMTAQGRPRARDLGIKPGLGSPGPLNAITDVAGVRVGHTTLIAGDTVRTGVTAILPHGGNLFREKVPGAVFVGNAFGKLAGSTQVQELGTIESPIVLTNTLGVGVARRRRRPVDARAARQRERPVRQRAGRRNQRRRPERHPRPARHPRPRHLGDCLRARGRRRRRRGRRRHRHRRVRLEGRHRHRVETRAAAERHVDRRRAGAVELRRPPDDRRRAGVARADARGPSLPRTPNLEPRTQNPERRTPNLEPTPTAPA